MLDYFTKQIKPLNDELGRQLGQNKINVRYVSYAWPITVQVVENDIVVHCNHAGNYIDTIDYYFEPDNTYERPAWVCDKCNAWSADGRDWNE